MLFPPTNLPDVRNVAVIWLDSKEAVRDHHFTARVWRPRNIVHRSRRRLRILVDVHCPEIEFYTAIDFDAIKRKYIFLHDNNTIKMI